MKLPTHPLKRIRKIRDLLADLPSEADQAIILARQEGFTWKEIEKAWGKTINRSLERRTQ